MKKLIIIGISLTVAGIVYIISSNIYPSFKKNIKTKEAQEINFEYPTSTARFRPFFTFCLSTRLLDCPSSHEPYLISYQSSVTSVVESRSVQVSHQRFTVISHQSSVFLYYYNN